MGISSFRSLKEGSSNLRHSSYNKGLPELAILNTLFNVSVGRCQYPDIYPDILLTPNLENSLSCKT